MNNKLEVIGIDHGWSMMKTISQVFVTGVKSIVDKAKEKGRSALYRLSEFLGIKKRLLDIRENVRGAIKTTDKDIAKTELLAKGFREAGQTVTNAFRTFADKPEVDYSQKEQKQTEPERAEAERVEAEAGKTFDCLRTVEDWNKFQMRLRLKLAGTTLNITDLEWTKLLSVVRLYNQGKVSIPALDECKTIKEKVSAINIFNHSDRIFTETTWKSCCRNDRMSQVLELEDLKDLLNEIGAVLINAGEQSSI